jgi:DHA2 family multidrug resistance protein-like MFS transporter
VTETETTTENTRKEWMALAVLGLPTLLVAMDFSVLYLATPHLTASLAPSGVQQLWIVDIYGFVIAGFLVTMGTLGDRIGRKKLLLIGGVAFAAASISAAYSQSAEMLLISRAALGVAGAMVMPSALALATGLFADPKLRSRAIAIYLSCFMGGIALGPVVGGALLNYFWWGSVFLISLPGMAVLLLAGPALLPDAKSDQGGKLDPISVVMSLLTILPFIYGLKELARNGWATLPIVALVFGLVMGFVFVQRQLHLEHPMLDLTLFRNKTFSGSLSVNFLGGIIGTGTYLFVTLYLQNVTGISPLQTGLLLVPPAILMILGNMLSPALANYVRPAYLIAIGMVIAAIGYAGFVLAGPTSRPWVIFLAFCVSLIGTGPMAALGNQMIMGSAPPEKTGAAASVMQTANELGLGLGIAFLGTLGTVVYQHQIQDKLGGLPAGVADASKQSVDRAVAAAGSLPKGQGDALLATARDAFTSGTHAVGIASAVISLVLAAISAVTLRHVRDVQGGGEDGQAEEQAPSDEPVGAKA